MACPVMGETPMSPVIVESGTLVMPAFVRITNSLAVPRMTLFTAVEGTAWKAAAITRTKRKDLDENILLFENMRERVKMIEIKIMREDCGFGIEIMRDEGNI
jgi:hypothetical protein